MQQQNNQAQEIVNSQILKAGGKTYFFDVKKAKNGNNYLTISETWKKPTGEAVRNRLMIFSDYLQDFMKTLLEAEKFLK